MKKYQYKLTNRVFVEDSSGVYPGTIIAIDDGLYQVAYDDGGYDWLLADEISPLQYHRGDYVYTSIGYGQVIAVDDLDLITVSYGKPDVLFNYYEFELKPAPKPSLWARLFKKGVGLYA